MKTLFVALVALLFAFFLGCQSSITDPVTPDQTKLAGAVDQETLAYKDVINTWPGLIRINTATYDPSHPHNGGTVIDGKIRYKLEKVDEVHGFSFTEDIKVSIYVTTELKNDCPRQNGPCKVFGFQDAIVKKSLNANQVYYLEKSFRVRNTCCAPLNLVFKFQVEGKVVTLVSMELKKVPGLFFIPDPEM